MVFFGLISQKQWAKQQLRCGWRLEARLSCDVGEGWLEAERSKERGEISRDLGLVRSKERKKLKKKKKTPKKYTGRNAHTGWNYPKFTETTEMTRNTTKFFSRWNGGLSRTGLHTGTRFSGCSSRNRTKNTTLFLIPWGTDPFPNSSYIVIPSLFHTCHFLLSTLITS